MPRGLLNATLQKTLRTSGKTLTEEDIDASIYEKLSSHENSGAHPFEYLIVTHG